MSRPRIHLTLLPMIGGAICLGSALAGGAWWLLPLWMPSLVCQHAPWVEPVARAAVTDPGLEPFLLLRYHEWGTSADVGMVRCLSHHDPKVRKLVAQALISQTPQQ